MNHAKYCGTPYDAGVQFGKEIKRKGLHMQDIVPFPIDEKRKTFAKACEQIYKEICPSILVELQGIAAGSGTDYEFLMSAALSMYCIMPDQRCTNICFQTKDGILLGRNSDFLTCIEDTYTNCIYGMQDAYAFIGNTTAFVEMEDGINEYGFAIGLTSVYPKNIQPGFNAGMLVRYLLEHCKNVKEALQFLETLPIASSQTLAMADADGAAVIVECSCSHKEVLYVHAEQPYAVSTNAFHTKSMKMQYVAKQPWEDWRQEERYQMACAALADKKVNFDVTLMKELLSGKYGFICQYDRHLGADTVWSVIYDPKHKKIYRAEGNPGYTEFLEDQRFTFR